MYVLILSLFTCNRAFRLKIIKWQGQIGLSNKPKVKLFDKNKIYVAFPIITITGHKAMVCKILRRLDPIYILERGRQMTIIILKLNKINITST